MQEDRFAYIEQRLDEIRVQETALHDERTALEKEQAILLASSMGFRIGRLIEWTDPKKGLTQGKIEVVWPAFGTGWRFVMGVRKPDSHPELPLIQVGRSKKPRPI
jgi:hypothetical protein